MTEAVIQADRDAACEIYRKFRYGQPPLYTNIAAGRIDHDPIVQAFAAHRLAARREALEEAARVAEGFEDPSRDWLLRSVWDNIKRDTAARIRNLAQEPRA